MFILLRYPIPQTNTSIIVSPVEVDGRREAEQHWLLEEEKNYSSFVF
jgi:hypothetical protein